MKILICQDQTLKLPLPEIALHLSAFSPELVCEARAVNVQIRGEVVSFEDTHRDITRQLGSLMEQFDLIGLVTDKPYDNNYFCEQLGRLLVLSLFGWEMLTDLSRENGVVYFFATLIADQIGLGTQHHATTGCISDFLWQKTDVDVCMRSAFVCADCVGIFQASKPDSKRNLLYGAVKAILNDLSTASRANRSILAFWTSAETSLFDVFLCHNSDDKYEVRRVNSLIKERGLRTWLDEEQLRPGLPWQEALDQQIVSIKSAAVFVGSNGRGPWQNIEIRAFLSEFVERKCPVIPVILATCATIPELPRFLREMTWVDFRRNTPDPMAQLCWGITGERPS